MANKKVSELPVESDLEGLYALGVDKNNRSVRVLLECIQSLLSGGMPFGGIATPDTEPAISDQNVFYIATEPGTYANFGGITVNDGEAVILQWNNGTWSKNVTGFATSEKLTELEKKLGNNDNVGKILGKKGTAETILDTYIKASTGEVISLAVWKSFSADVSGYGKIKCTVGFAASDANVGLAFYDGEDTYFNGYYKLENRGYEKVTLVIPENAKTAKWSWLDNGDEPFKYDGDYELTPIPSLSTDIILYGEEVLTESIDRLNKVAEGLNAENFKGNAHVIPSYLVMFDSGEVEFVSGWKSFSADVSGYRKIKCFIGSAPSRNVGLIPENAKTAKWSWLVDGNENQPFKYDGDYELIPKPAVSSQSVSYRNMTQEEFNMEVERNLDELSGFTGSINNIEGVVDHNTENLLDPDGTEKTFNDGVNSFSPPNEGYELSNRIDAAAGEWFTRTGTATGMIVVTDSEDKNGQRLTGEGGVTLGNSFQIPQEMSWVRYIRIAVQVAGAKDGSVVICRGKHAFTGEERGDYITIPSLRVEKRNLAKDVAYLSAPDGTYWELYIDGNDGYKLSTLDLDTDF